MLMDAAVLRQHTAATQAAMAGKLAVHVPEIAAYARLIVTTEYANRQVAKLAVHVPATAEPVRTLDALRHGLYAAAG